jgi:hypothetical protein
MIKRIYAIRDQKSKTYDNPFPQLTHEEAFRTFTSIVNAKNTINSYPEDFDLYYLGEYETNTGKVLPLDTPLHMYKAVDVHRGQPQELVQPNGKVPYEGNENLQQ